MRCRSNKRHANLLLGHSCKIASIYLLFIVRPDALILRHRLVLGDLIGGGGGGEEVGGAEGVVLYGLLNHFLNVIVVARRFGRRRGKRVGADMLRGSSSSGGGLGRSAAGAGFV